MMETVRLDYEVAELAADLVGLWEAQKIGGLSRSERNAAIESIRQQLIELVAMRKRAMFSAAAGKEETDG